MSETQTIGNINVGSAYATSFGSIPNGTRYVDVATKSDMRGKIYDAMQVGMKALQANGNLYATSTSYSATSGSIPSMVPIYVDPLIVDTTRKNTPIVEILPRVTNQGLTADYNYISAKGGAKALSEDSALSESDTTVTRGSKAIKYLYAVGRVTGQAQAAIPSYVMRGMMPSSGAVGSWGDANAMNAKQFEVLVKTREIRELEENMIVNGNATTSAISGNANGTEFDGIITLMSTTNKVDKNTSALSLDDINTAIRYAFDDGGRPNLAICSSAVYTDLLGLLTAKIGYLQATAQVFWGFSTIVLHTMVGDIPVVPSMYMSNTTGSKAMYFLDLSIIEMRVLQDLTYEDLAKTNDSDKFMLKIYETMIIRNTAFCSSIMEIA